MEFYIDGGTKNNGLYTQQESYICATDKKGKIIFFEKVGDKTNNEAELLAFLELLKRRKNKKMYIYCDSQLTVNLFNTCWKTKIFRLKMVLHDIWTLSKQRLSVFITWIPREQNKAGYVIEERTGL